MHPLYLLTILLPQHADAEVILKLCRVCKYVRNYIRANPRFLPGAARALYESEIRRLNDSNARIQPDFKFGLWLKLYGHPLFSNIMRTTCNPRELIRQTYPSCDEADSGPYKYVVYRRSIILGLCLLAVQEGEGALASEVTQMTTGRPRGMSANDWHEYHYEDSRRYYSHYASEMMDDLVVLCTFFRLDDLAQSLAPIVEHIDMSGDVIMYIDD